MGDGEHGGELELVDGEVRGHRPLQRRVLRPELTAGQGGGGGGGGGRGGLVLES